LLDFARGCPDDSSSFSAKNQRRIDSEVLVVSRRERKSLILIMEEMEA
jgi:hypothetical protein